MNSVSVCVLYSEWSDVVEDAKRISDDSEYFSFKPLYGTFEYKLTETLKVTNYYLCAGDIDRLHGLRFQSFYCLDGDYNSTLINTVLRRIRPKQ